MDIKSFKKFIKKREFDPRDFYITSLDDDQSTDDHEGVDVIDSNISQKNAFDPKDLFKKKKKVKP